MSDLCLGTLLCLEKFQGNTEQYKESTNKENGDNQKIDFWQCTGKDSENNN